MKQISKKGDGADCLTGQKVLCCPGPVSTATPVKLGDGGKARKLFTRRLISPHADQQTFDLNQTRFYQIKFSFYFNEFLISASGCVWTGTSPVCDGGCDKKGQVVTEISKTGDGTSCVTGNKVLCCADR